jgi:hypothetical protein
LKISTDDSSNTFSVDKAYVVTTAGGTTTGKDRGDAIRLISMGRVE